MTVLHIAAYNNDVDVIETILRQRVDMNITLANKVSILLHVNQ